MSKIGFKRSPTTSTRPGTAKRPRPAAAAVLSQPPPSLPAFLYNNDFLAQRPQPAPSPEKLAELHAAAFCALRSAVEANDDGLVRRMREWEDRYARRRSAPTTAAGSKRRRRRQASEADMQLARALPLPTTADDDDGEEDDDDDQLIIHTSPGAGLASCPPRPALAPMAVDHQHQPAGWTSAPLPAFSNPFAPNRRIDSPRGPHAHSHNYVAYRNSSSCTSSSDDEDADIDMVWEEELESSSPYLSSTTTTSSDADVDELELQLAAGCGAIEDYSVDAILALQMQAAGRA